MKTEIIEQESQTEWKFPCLGKSKTSGIVVLFTSYGEGTVLMKFEGNADEGEYINDWAMDSFYPITEPITIKFIP